MRVTHRWLAGVAAVAAIALAGCSGGDAEQTTPMSGAAPAVAPAEDRDLADQSGGAAAKEGGAPATDAQAKAPNLSVDQRSIVYTGSITLRVEDVNRQAARVTAIAAGAGGFVGSDKRTSGATDSGEATIELRVPADRFQSVLDQLAAELGNEEQRSVNTQDVTEETLDLAARIKTQQARVDSGRRLLAEAKTLKDLVMLESELASREADLASLLAKQSRLTDLTTLSTITLVLLDPAAPGRTGPGDDPGFLGGLAAGWDALVASLKVLLTVLGAVLPWLIALGLPAAGLFWLLRRTRRTRTPAIAADPEPAPAE
jgi:hypothetical protein